MTTAIELSKNHLCIPVKHATTYGDDNFPLGLELLTEEELVLFLRIPHVSNSKNYHNVIENLKRMHGLPRIHICGKTLYPIKGIQKWIEEKTLHEK
ncbi:MAG: hypothetical protein DRP56_10470 [Planctomycetota bacterium]|nr:MAG: hypothetical protein DRP56_10470 [Planctomycetota bacterium]